MSRSPYLDTPSQAHTDPRNGGNYFASPPLAGTVGPHPAGYSPALLPAASYGPLPGPQLQAMPYGPPPPQQLGMFYPSPAPPQQILLGFIDCNSGNSQKAVCGPPGASYDWLGNLYFDRGNGVKEWIGPYRDWNGKIRHPPGSYEALKEDCCRVC